MFWRVSGLNTASPVDSILDKESYTLEELLDEDELIQECKSLNARLTAYLKQKDTVEKLVRYLVEPPPADADPKRSFKYPFTACEIFCCEVEGIFNTLLENEDVLAQLFSLLQAPRPLNCMLAGYFSRVMGSLLLRRTQDIMQYLQKHQELLLQLVEHVDTTSIAEVLVRLVGADEQRAFLSTNHLQWLSETNLLYLLLDKLQPGQPVEAQSNAAEILAALAQSQVSPLTRNLAEPQFLELLVEQALRPGAHATAAGAKGEAETPAAPAAGSTEPPAEAPATNTDPGGGAAPDVSSSAAQGEAGAEAKAADAKADAEAAKPTAGAEAAPQAAAGSESDGADDTGALGSNSSSAMMHALNVCIALVEPLPPTPAEQQAAAQGLGLGPLPTPAIDAAAVEIHAAMRAQAIQCISKSIDRLVALLEAVDADRQLPTSYGLLRPPVGLARLKAVELLAALLHSGDEAAESAVMSTRGVQRSMELFLQFPFNNVLHRHVATLVTAMDQGSPRLAAFLLEDCGLLGWLADAPTEVTPLPRPGDTRGENERKPLRAGYVGHITQISNRLIQVANDGQQQLRAAMDADGHWQQYVKERLDPRNAEENVYAWKCGRPTMHEPVVDSEADMFQTDLDFGSIESEAFTRDVYQRYGVFASHEDEEVDSEQPQWAMELASAASAAGAVASGPGKLPLPSASGPQPFPVYDSSSSSEDESDEEHGAAVGSADSSADAEVSVTPAPDSYIVLVDSSGSAGAAGGTPAVAPRAPLGSDDADMQDDAVMLEYETAEQLVNLSLADAPEDSAMAAEASADQPSSEGSEGDGGNGPDASAAAGDAPPQRAGQGEGGEATNGPATVTPASA
ncbi:hypothetical protein ABPG75_001192 [Micractinium tetrahymenae]